jgi:N-acetylneuraminate synthase/N,N'-diacetyllegionaminate synthase
MSKKISHTFIIAEAGVNHNGQLDLALRLCDTAKESGVDAIKFQTWKTEKILTRNVAKAEYQQRNVNTNESQFEMIKKLELSYTEFETINKYCEQIGLKFLSTPDEEESLFFLLKLGMDIIKVGSGDINNISFLRKIGKTGLPIILSTGMSSLADVEKAFDTLYISGTHEITLLHCTTNYPCPMDEVNLQAMKTLSCAFKVPVGYSDHTMGIEVPIAAVALGAQIIEKHFTLNRTMEGPDHKASLEPEELRQMVQAIRNIEKALGNGIKKPNISEQKIETVVKKKIVATRHISKGEIFTDENINIKRSQNGLSAEHWDLIYGLMANRNYEQDEPINL